MALAIYRSNRLDVLATVLGSLLQSPDQLPADPFAPVQLVVGTRGMERWLRHQLAVQLGICAHVEFPFVRQLMDRLLQLAEGAAEPVVDPWCTGSLTWRVLQALQDLPPAREDDLWAPVRAYLDGPTGVVGARQHALAVLLGDLFDRYVTYRPDLARAWSAGQRAPARDLPQRDGPGSARDLPGSLAWQPALWQRLVGLLGDTAHTAERLARARAVFEAGPVAGLDQPIRLFGLSTLPPSWLELLTSVSRHHRVELYLTSPSNAWWGDLHARRGDALSLRTLDRDQVSQVLLADPEALAPEGNPLLLSLGRVARDLQLVLESLDEGYVDQDLQLFVDSALPFQDPAVSGRPTALQQLQSDVLNLVHPASREPALLSPVDDSVQVHACYGPTRQVEALRDALLGLFETHRDLQPRDVVVMTPDIDAYAPLISAVFDQGASGRRQAGGEPVRGGEGWGPAGAPRLAYEIADLSVRRLNPVADALLRVLELATSRVTASAVFDLARLEPVRTRFGLETDDLERLVELVHRAGARWGLDGPDRAAHDQPQDRQNTWVDALDRLWLGVAMPDSGGLYAGLVPVDELEGSDVDRLGALGELVGVVLTAVRELQAPRPLSAWTARLRRLVADLTDAPDQAAWLTRRALEALDGLEEEAAGVGLDVSVQAVTAALVGRFDVAAGGLRPQTGALTFCALTPMRTLPYRVVCLLGMDEDAFPAQSQRAAFDLTGLAPRVGDRDRRDEDRLLLLEAVLAAQDHLLVLYSGRDVRNDEPLPPCVPVAELLDTLDATVQGPSETLASEALTVRHPLQAFSPRTFLPPQSGQPWHRRAFSFDRRLAAGSRVTPSDAMTPFWQTANLAVDPDPVLSLVELQAFLDHPAKVFFRQALGLSLWDGVDLFEDREPVTLDQDSATARLVDAALAAGSDDAVSGRLDAAVARLRGEAVLPLGSAGTWSVAGPRRLAVKLRTGAAPWRTQAPEHVDLDLALAPGLRLVGRVHGLHQGDHFTMLPFKDTSGRSWWLLGPLLQLLAWQAVTPGQRCRAVVLHGHVQGGEPKLQWRTLQAPEGIEAPQGAALALLRRLAALAISARTAPSGLYGASADAFVKTLASEGDPPPGGWLGATAWPPEDEASVLAVRSATVAAFKAWDGGEWDKSAYLRRLYPDGHPPWLGEDSGLAGRAFADAALAVWGTVRSWRTVLRKPPTPTAWETP